MILRAYVDDSGSDDGGGLSPRHFVLAGYVLPSEKWEPLSERWVTELAKKPSVACFKMSDAEYGNGHFQGIQEPFRKLKVNELAQVISDYEPRPISCHLQWSDYKALVQGRVHEKIDSPYALLFYQIIKLSHDWQIERNRMNPSLGFHQVDYAFDEQGRIGSRARQWYAGLKDRMPEPYKTMMGNTPSFEDDEEVVALQAADMIAWHIHRYLEAPHEDRPVMEKIMKHHEGRIITQESMQEFVEQSKRADPKQLANGF